MPSQADAKDRYSQANLQGVRGRTHQRIWQGVENGTKATNSPITADADQSSQPQPEDHPQVLTDESERRQVLPCLLRERVDGPDDFGEEADREVDCQSERRRIAPEPVRMEHKVRDRTCHYTGQSRSCHHASSLSVLSKTFVGIPTLTRQVRFQRLLLLLRNEETSDKPKHGPLTGIPIAPSAIYLAAASAASGSTPSNRNSPWKLHMSGIKKAIEMVVTRKTLDQEEKTRTK